MGTDGAIAIARGGAARSERAVCAKGRMFPDGLSAGSALAAEGRASIQRHDLRSLRAASLSRRAGARRAGEAPPSGAVSARAGKIGEF